MSMAATSRWNPGPPSFSILVPFIITGLDTMLRHDREWNEPAMGNSAADAMKLTSMVATLISVPRMEEHRCVEVDEHGQRWRLEP
jgi:hypothetical protein